MRKSFLRLAAPLALCALLPGCFTFTHTVGRGPQGPTPQVTEETQWFALWGLVPLDPVDSAALTGPVRDYRVTTKFTLVDVVITAFSSFVTLYRQTIVVEK
ncbi:MAG: hypothetical protein JNL90_12460 [Planctomycetes bacterium]|nr:hypothetical protein [Planctomycetota bacterium]